MAKAKQKTGFGKILSGMLILCLGGLLLGASLGFIGTKYYLNTAVLKQMQKEGYVLTGDATATSEDIMNGKSGYVNGTLVEGSLVAFTTSDATIIPEYLVKGKTAFADGELIVGTMNTLAAQKIMPTTVAQTIEGKVYLTGDLVITGDPDLKPENIKYGVTIFGVRGTYSPLADNGQ